MKRDYKFQIAVFSDSAGVKEPLITKLFAEANSATTFFSGTSCTILKGGNRITWEFQMFSRKIFGSSVDQMKWAPFVLFVYAASDGMAKQEWLANHMKKMTLRYKHIELIGVKWQQKSTGNVAHMATFCQANGLKHVTDVAELYEYLMKKTMAKIPDEPAPQTPKPPSPQPQKPLYQAAAAPKAGVTARPAPPPPQRYQPRPTYTYEAPSWDQPRFLSDGSGPAFSSSDDSCSCGSCGSCGSGGSGDDS